LNFNFEFCNYKKGAPKMSTKQIEKPTKAVLVDTRCRYVSASGRRCRALAARDTSRVSGLSAFCIPHSQLDQQFVNTDSVVEELFAGADNFRTAVAVNDVLGRLFILQAQNRIPIRNAMALAYTAQVILSSLETLCDEVVRVRGRASHNAIINSAFNAVYHPRHTEEDQEEAEEENAAADQSGQQKSSFQEQVDAVVNILRG
jgi:hypothetical protein